MKLRFSHPLRIISVIVLAVFLWDFCLFESAYAISNSSKSHVSGTVLTRQETGDQKTEERFQRTLEDMETILADTSTDSDTKDSRLRGKKAEIESYEADIRKQFAETEQKIKDLPEVIKQRHRDFVRKYNENMSTLKADLDGIGKASRGLEKEYAHRKTKEFLERAKHPKRHTPLDPNKLPFRNVKPVHREPRTKPEEFTEGKNIRAEGITQKPLLVASNGPLTGILSSDSTVHAQGSMQIALANPPSNADLAQTIEVQFTPAITAKAQELGNDPVQIYNWVRNNIEYVPTYGSIQGADMCLQTKLCNDFDTASLLIALLRVSGIHAHYVSGTIQLPIDQAVNWVGRFTDHQAALNYIASGGIPASAGISGGNITSVRMEHIWVEAFINYIPSRGARHKTGKGDTWIPLDASYKQYTYTQGIDIKSAVPFDAQTFIDQIQSTATIDTVNNSVTNVNSLYIQQQMQDYQTSVQNYISQNYPNATVGDVLGKKEIIQQSFPFLLGTLPYKTIVKGTTYSEIPNNLRHHVSFSVIIDSDDSETGTPINITKSLPELAGKKMTLSYSPATSADEAVINSFLPVPNPDGSPIQPSQLPSQLPAYLINVVPELRVDGVVVATGTPLGLGSPETFSMTFTSPNIGSDKVTRVIGAGEYTGIALDLGKIVGTQMTNLQTKLQATQAKLQANDFTNLTKDDIIGDLLYAAALSYYAEYNAMNSVQARAIGVEQFRLPSEATFSNTLAVVYFFGIPRWVKAGGLVMDVTQNIVVAVASDGDSAKEIQFMLASGRNSSELEHSIPERFFSAPDDPAEGISAVKALKIANDQGIPIYSINESNVNVILPQLQLSAEVKEEILSAVSMGKIVTVSKSNISFGSWNGCGYIITDPNTGNGAYRISGGMNGGWTFSLRIQYLFWLTLERLAFFALIASLAILGAILIEYLAAIIVAIAEAVVRLSILWEPYIANTLFGLLTLATYLCWLASPPTPPNEYTYACALILTLYWQLSGLPRR